MTALEMALTAKRWNRQSEINNKIAASTTARAEIEWLFFQTANSKYYFEDNF